MTLDPQIARYLEKLAATNPPPMSDVPVDVIRQGVRKNRLIQVQDHQVLGAGGTFTVRVFNPPAAGPLPAMVYFHGGGWVHGDIDTTDPRARLLAEWVPCVVISVNYRKAPEHKFPAAVEDAFAATAWVADHAAELGVDPDRIGVGGDSAGGNLAAVVALMARDRGGVPKVALQYLCYPVTVCGRHTPSRVEKGAGFGLTHASMQWYEAQYLRGPEDADSPLASPLLAADHGNLPPALVVVAGYDPLHDEGVDYANALQAAGNRVVLQDYSSLIHGFFSQGVESDAIKHAIADSCGALHDLFEELSTAKT